MMALRIYWRASRRRCVAELVIAAALVAPSMALAMDKEPAPRITAREAMERQFAAPATPREAMSGEEAALIAKKYRARIGQMLEPKREIGGDRPGR